MPYLSNSVRMISNESIGSNHTSYSDAVISLDDIHTGVAGNVGSRNAFYGGEAGANAVVHTTQLPPPPRQHHGWLKREKSKLEREPQDHGQSQIHQVRGGNRPHTWSTWSLSQQRPKETDTEEEVGSDLGSGLSRGRLSLIPVSSVIDMNNEPLPSGLLQEHSQEQVKPGSKSMPIPTRDSTTKISYSDDHDQSFETTSYSTLERHDNVHSLSRQGSIVCTQIRTDEQRKWEQADLNSEEVVRDAANEDRWPTSQPTSVSRESSLRKRTEAVQFLTRSSSRRKMSGSHAETEPNNDLIRTDSKLSPKTGGEDSETTYYGGGAKEKLSPVVEDSECHVGEFAVSSASLNPCLKLDFILSAIEAEYLDHSTSLDPENHDPKVIPDEEDYDYRQQPDCEKPHPYKLRKPAGLSVRIPNKSNKSGVDQDERLQSTFFSSLQHHQPSRQDSKDMKHNHRTVACIKENQQRHHHANAQLIRQDRDPYRDRGSPPPTAPTNNSREPNRGFEENQRKSKRVSLSAGAVILAPIDLYEKPIQIRLHGSRSSHSGPSSVKSLGEEKSDNLSSDDNVRRSGSSEKKKRNGIGRSGSAYYPNSSTTVHYSNSRDARKDGIFRSRTVHHYPTRSSSRDRNGGSQIRRDSRTVADYRHRFHDEDSDDAFSGGRRPTLLQTSSKIGSTTTTRRRNTIPKHSEAHDDRSHGQNHQRHRHHRRFHHNERQTDFHDHQFRHHGVQSGDRDHDGGPRHPRQHRDSEFDAASEVSSDAEVSSDGTCSYSFNISSLPEKRRKTGVDTKSTQWAGSRLIRSNTKSTKRAGGGFVETENGDAPAALGKWRRRAPGHQNRASTAMIDDGIGRQRGLVTVARRATCGPSLTRENTIISGAHGSRMGDGKAEGGLGDRMPGMGRDRHWHKAKQSDSTAASNTTDDRVSSTLQVRSSGSSSVDHQTAHPAANRPVRRVVIITPTESAFIPRTPSPSPSPSPMSCSQNSSRNSSPAAEHALSPPSSLFSSSRSNSTLRLSLSTIASISPRMTNQESVSPSCSLASSPSPSRSATTTSIGSSSSLASPDLSFRMEREDEIGSGFELPQVLQLLNEGEQHQNGLTSEIPSQTRGRIPISDDAKASGNLITAPDMPANSIAADDGAPYVQQNDANQHPQSHEEQGTGVAGHNDDGFGGLREKLGPVAVDGIVDVVGTDNVHNNTAPSDRDKEGTGHPPQKDAENENVPLGILALQVVQNSIMKVGVARLF